MPQTSQRHLDQLCKHRAALMKCLSWLLGQNHALLCCKKLCYICRNALCLVSNCHMQCCRQLHKQCHSHMASCDQQLFLEQQQQSGSPACTCQAWNARACVWRSMRAKAWLARSRACCWCSRKSCHAHQARMTVWFCITIKTCCVFSRVHFASCKGSMI